ncbi:3'-5' exonuclease [Caenimonas sedimenti]|uniref:3'-5' exonuclease n=1 Tax=Caenimonas sedimenti TaxID=2596921 RepID=A0A562ZRS8_9BURK|nr:3'-5' exonuclease [Caenimonas sedimenti]TWO71107.1 3'-5' exonuclease [Caenimonas sedimenti]
MPIAVIDFETTGLSPAMGDRATEIAIVMVEGDREVGRFESLMNAGVRIPAFIEAFTGITNEMIDAAPPADEVMAAAARFVGDAPLVAHNASFDRRFWAAELERLGPDAPAANPFACTMLLSRRLYPEAMSFRLGSLAAFHDLSYSSRAHRAMADAEVAAALLKRIRRDLERRYDAYEPGHELLVKVGKAPKKRVGEAIAKYLGARGEPRPGAAASVPATMKFESQAFLFPGP